MAKGQTLNARQLRHIEEYLIDCNAMESAMRAGYSESWARKCSAMALAKPQMAAALAKAMERRSKRTEITADWVLKNLKKVAKRCMQKVPVMKFDPEDKCMKQAEEDGQGVWTFDASGANRSLELIGKNLKMFTDKVEHSGKDGKDLIPPVLQINFTGTE